MSNAQENKPRVWWIGTIIECHERNMQCPREFVSEDAYLSLQAENEKLKEANKKLEKANALIDELEVVIKTMEHTTIKLNPESNKGYCRKCQALEKIKQYKEM